MKYGEKVGKKADDQYREGRKVDTSAWIRQSYKSEYLSRD